MTRKVRTRETITLKEANSCKHKLINKKIVKFDNVIESTKQSNVATVKNDRAIDNFK